MSIPLISVIIPAYNAAETIGGALASVLGQTTDYRLPTTDCLPSLEIIVVDDCSTDGTAERVDSFIRQLDDSEETGKKTYAAVSESSNPRISESSNHLIIESSNSPAPESPWIRNRQGERGKGQGERGKGKEERGKSQETSRKREAERGEGRARSGKREDERARREATGEQHLLGSNMSCEQPLPLSSYLLPSVRLIRLPRNSGPAAARNAGIREAKGEWLAFLDADDAWFPWRLADELETLRLFPDADMICAGETIGGTSVDRHPPSRGLCREIALMDFVDENPVSTSTVLVRKEAVIKAGLFDEQFRGPEDVDLWMRIAARGQTICLQATVARYMEKQGSLSMSPNTFLPQILAVYRKAFGEGGVLRQYRHRRHRALARRYSSAAWGYCECGQRGKALAALARSCLIHPGSIVIKGKERPLLRLRLLTRILRRVSTEKETAHESH